MSVFATATAVRPVGDGVYEATADGGWWAPNGPNGGYLAAIVLRALQAEVDDAAFVPRSLTCHFLRPPHEGPLRLEAEVLKRGRSVVFTGLRGVQDDRVCVHALGAFGNAAGAEAESWEAAMPDVPAADAIEPWPVHEQMPPIAKRIEMRPAVGAPLFSGAEDATTGGWMAVREHDGTVDAAVLALLSDAWLPAAFPRLTEPAAAPTIDLTIHFRRAAGAPAEHVLGIFTSRLSAEGLFEEDGELFSPDGVLLAQSRQLALLR